MFNTIKSDGVEKGIARNHEMKAESRKTGDYNINGADINELGYQLLSEDMIKKAIESFKLNVAEFPKSWNVYDNMTEAYMKKRDKELAIQKSRWN